ncbi:tyrosinase-like [Leptodactylus fuscus]|uniref:tyrosinase-like n=1 Tax=Leptodactylus fuscus TaxID=238119 RepID=UPI003F4EB36D
MSPERTVKPYYKIVRVDSICTQDLGLVKRHQSDRAQADKMVIPDPLQGDGWTDRGRDLVNSWRMSPPQPSDTDTELSVYLTGLHFYQIFTNYGALCTDDCTIFIRSIIRMFLIPLVLVLGFSAVHGQFPKECTTDLALKSKICCPLWKGSPCGEHAGRGECPIKYIAEYSQVSEAPHEGKRYNDDRLNWPTSYFKYYCRCKGNYTGYDCGQCKYGLYGEKCQQRKTVVRKEIHKLNETEKERFICYLNMTKYTTSKDYVILVTDNRDDPSTYRFINASIYNMLVWIHHYLMKPVRINGTYQHNTNFAHKGPAFAPWHRCMLLFAEREIQLCTGNEDFALPLYDSTQDENCSICSNDLLGPSDMEGKILNSSCFSSWRMMCSDSGSPYTYCESAIYDTPKDCVQRTPGIEKQSTLPSRPEMLNILKWKDYDTPPYNTGSLCSFRNALEGNIDASDGRTPGNFAHNKVHGYMGGAMAMVSVSANDPMFFVHHCYIDFCYQKWIEKYNVRPEDFPENPIPGHHPQDFPPPFYPAYKLSDFHQTSWALGYTYDNIEGYH